MTGTSRPGLRLRGRRSARVSGDDRQAAILATAEELLATRPLAAVSVDDLARGAGISRPTFYFYFPSKDAVLLALWDRVVAEADRASAQAFARPSAERPLADPRERWRAAIAAYRDTFTAHRAVTLAATELRFTNQEVRDAWARVTEGWVAACAASIESERRRGAAPPGLPARDLAVALVSLNERVIYGALSGDGPALTGDQAVDVVLTVWLSAIYSPATRSTAPAPAEL